LFYLCQSTEVLEFVSSFMVHRLTPARRNVSDSHLNWKLSRCGVSCMAR
jgi:hypothetical protein